MNRSIVMHSEEDTVRLAEKLGRDAVRGTVFALMGELGTGKTVFARGIARGLGITGPVTSPTFTLLEIYEGSLPLYHFDLYRIECSSEFDQLFFEEYWEGDGVSVIEWADKAIERLPENTTIVRFEYIDDLSRRLTIEYPDN